MPAGSGRMGAEMGIYYNPRGYKFAELLNGEIFIDKTGLLAQTDSLMCSPGKYICFSAPEGSGRTSAAHMLASFYGSGYDEHPLFRNQLIAGNQGWEQNLNQFHVILLPIKELGESGGSMEEKLEALSKQVTGELLQQNPQISGLHHVSLGAAMQDIYQKTGKGFILLVDDWDYGLQKAGMGNDLCQKKENEKYLSFLKGLLGDKEHIFLAVLWGSMPVKYQDTGFGDIFTDYSLYHPGRMAEYMGLTWQEADVFCQSRERGPGSDDLQEWYGGYLWNRVRGYHTKGAVKALLNGRYVNEWSVSEQEMTDKLRAYGDELQDAVVSLLAGEKVKINPRAFYDKEEGSGSSRQILAEEVFQGRLAWAEEEGAVFIPNRESREFYRSVMRRAGDRRVAVRGKYPDRETALRILTESERLNPGPWKEHSCVAARCAERIACQCKDMDREKAYVLALLHDIGRRFSTGHLRHVVDGYVYMTKLGFEDAAKICVTHSFPMGSLQEYIGKFDVSQEETKLLSGLLSTYEYDDYDRLVQLCDSVAMPEGPVKAEVRMDSVAVRYGYYPPEKRQSVLKLKAYFEQKMNKGLYEVIL